MAVLLAVCLGMSLYNNMGLKKQYDTAAANMKAYDSQLSTGNTENKALQLTVD